MRRRDLDGLPDRNAHIRDHHPQYALFVSPLWGDPSTEISDSTRITESRANHMPGRVRTRRGDASPWQPQVPERISPVRIKTRI